MADFNKAILHILKQEGGYANDPDDLGGETYQGISRKNNPNWTGWAVIDTMKLKRGQIVPKLTPKVIAYYRVAYWNKVIADKIINQGVATFLFDWYVTSGYHAIEAIQMLTNCRVDGVMGNNTLSAINKADNSLLGKLMDARVQFFKNIVKKRPSQEKFLDGWLNRVAYYRGILQ